MTHIKATGTVPQPSSFMHKVGGVALVLIAFYVGFSIAYNVWLSARPRTAAVVGKEPRKARQAASSRPDGKTNVIRWRTVPETYLLAVEIDGDRASAAVEKSLYDASRPGDRVEVTYQRRRLTGTLQVSNVKRLTQ